MTQIIWMAALAATIFSYRKAPERTRESLRKSLRTLKGLAPGVLGMVAVVGGTLAFFPERLWVHLFNRPGLQGLFLMSAVGALINIPGPIAFPLAGTLLKMGVKPASLAAFVTALTMVGIVTSPLEASSFGKRFTFFRQLLSFLAAMAIGFLMGGLL